MQAALEDKGIKHALNLVGNQHKYQIKATIIIALQYIGPSLFLAYLPFLDQSPTFFCHDDYGSDTNCYEYSGGCESNTISPDSPDSPVLELGLYCNRAYMRSLAQLCVAGIIGAGVFSFISDYYGRKKAMLFSYTLTAFSLFALATSASNHIAFSALFKLIGLGIGGYIAISITYLSEIGSEKFGRIASAIVFLVVATGVLVMAILVTKFLRWRLLFLSCMGIPSLLALLGFNFLDETPMFLYRNKDTAKTLQTLEKMAVTNNKLTDLGANIEANGVFRFTNDSDADTSRLYVQRWHYLQILKHPQLKYRVLIYSLIRFMASVAYWASFYVLFTRHEDSVIERMALVSIAETIGGLLPILLLKFGEMAYRQYLPLGFISGVVPSFLAFLIYAIGGQDFSGLSRLFIVTSLSIIMRFSHGWTRGLIYNRGNELFPVEVRSQCNGIGEIFAQSAGPLIPIIFKLANKENYSIPWLIVSLAVLACFGLSFLLPKEDLTTLEKGAEIELNLDENPKLDSQPLIAN